ncbi:MAG TPA: M20/M25/M40 family metallo-hydrolase [Pyrinomonadaceae bacterium]|nr:M20/M25/M40 family metallo-hydrolase [Pyrinomonadaceae bacterium]
MLSKISTCSFRKFLLPLVAFSLVFSSALAQQKTSDRSVPDVERLRAHITYLASDKLEGRRTGTPGAEDAARYVAEEFKRLGIAPGVKSPVVFQSGQRRAEGEIPDYFQMFPYVAGVELGKGNAMTLSMRGTDGSTQTAPATLDLRVGEDWMPLGFSAGASVENAPVVFVGYGIADAEQNYDDYKGADVRDKIALAFSGTPDGDNPHSRFTRSGEPRFKAAAARAAGAKVLVIIARDENFKDDKLTALKYDNAGGDAGLPVVAVSRQVAAKILGLGGSTSLTDVEKFLSDWANKMAEAISKYAAEHPGVNIESYGYSMSNRQALHSYGTLPLCEVPKSVALSITTDIVRKNAPAANVVGVLEGSDPKLKDEVIVIGAHYDHLGRGGEGSLAPREGEIHHGADDNASGTAGLLELARLFSQERELMRRTILFVAFGGEEEGLIGSSYYVEHPSRPLAQTVAMINMDMVGRLKDGALTVGGVGTSPEWRGWIAKANEGYKVTLNPSVVGGAQSSHTDADGTTRERGAAQDSPEQSQHSAQSQKTKDASATVVITGTDGRTVATATPVALFTLRLNEDGYGPSDHSSFYSKKIPVLFFFTGAHEDYHKPSDTADKINYEGEASVLQFVRDIVYALQSSDNRPAFTVAKSDANSRSTGFRVYLGTIPSYADSSDGLKLDGVKEGSPAEAAGLKAGDRVVRLAGHDVRNVYDYTQALSEMKAGQEYEVEVVRDGQRLTLKITPAVRK